MWTTIFKHDEHGVVELTHDFGNEVTVVTNPAKRTFREYHGQILFRDTELTDNLIKLDNYFQLLENVYNELTVKN